VRRIGEIDGTTDGELFQAGGEERERGDSGLRHRGIRAVNGGDKVARR
jgi:hypothetical protein